jgi:hypothetical protein
MFKRIEKRRRKKEEEDNLGLDENAKEILGMHDTDSDESDSNASSNGFVPKDVEDVEVHDLDSEDVSDKEDDRPSISVRDALRSPIYVVSVALDARSCVVCPGKTLKNSQMAAVHEHSDVCCLFSPL